MFKRTFVVGTAIVVALATTVLAGLPNPGMSVERGNTALVITDPQNDFLSPEGVTWGVVGESVTENNTVANIEALLKSAKTGPHYVSFLPATACPTREEL